MDPGFPTPTKGASLILSFRLHSQKIVIVGSNTLAASRAFAALEADSDVIVLTKGGEKSACEELRWRAEQKQLTLVDFDSLPRSSSSSSTERDAEAFDAYISSLKGIRLICVTDTLLGPNSSLVRTRKSASRLSQICRNRNIPINVTDHPDLCDFSFTSTHRFVDSDTGLPSALQIGVTTNGQGCRLATRLRRDIVSKVSKDAGAAVSKVGRMRSIAKAARQPTDEEVVGSSLNDEGIESTPNNPVAQRVAGDLETHTESARRRMRWVAQVSEYWSISKLAALTETEMTQVLDGKEGLGICSTGSEETANSGIDSQHSLQLVPPKPCGRIFLVGSGPGHPSLLTIATHNALTRHADLVLSDKLVPDAVLDLIPKNVEVRIARKFPGNADGAQSELMEAAIEAANRGLTVVRLKQGDPTVYGRAGEEVLFFRAHGYEPVVVPGVSSVLAGPSFGGIPVTQRGAAESFIVCTGVGRKGKEVKLPGYERSRTLVLLMGVARLPQILETLLSESTDPSSRRNGSAYPPHTPIALIERASMPDQRTIYSTLSNITVGLESVGEQRPPGMLVVGWSILSLWEKGDVTVLDEGGAKKDEERVRDWLGDSRWRVIEGLPLGWENI